MWPVTLIIVTRSLAVALLFIQLFSHVSSETGVKFLNKLILHVEIFPNFYSVLPTWQHSQGRHAMTVGTDEKKKDVTLFNDIYYD